MFEEDFVLRSIYIKGEISNCKYHYSGHIYFSLKDESGVISAVMFASNAASLKFRLTDGMQVVVYGNVTVYERDGRYQLYARSIEQDGLGDLYKRFEELKSRLEEMGMFSEMYKKSIPRFAMKIGIVTARTGAVIRDIYNVASRRNPYCRLMLYPAQVQGQGAAETIVKGIQVLDKKGLDCIIIGRGGGSIEDLWCFNEEIVARAIFDCETPIISAVGHETDFTIADFVADLRAPTPSAAAELAVFDYDQFLMDLDARRSSLQVVMDNKLRRYRDLTDMYRLRLENLSPEKMLMRKSQYLAELKARLDSIMEQSLRIRKDRLAIAAERLSGLSPLKRLSEGYAFAQKAGGAAIRSVKDVLPGEMIEVSVRDGRLGARVEDVREIKYEQQ